MKKQITPAGQVYVKDPKQGELMAIADTSSQRIGIFRGFGQAGNWQFYDVAYGRAAGRCMSIPVHHECRVLRIDKSILTPELLSNYNDIISKL